jgi:hypothetical protein
VSEPRRLGLLLASVLLAGCGRAGYDAVVPDGGANGGDDGDPTTPPPIVGHCREPFTRPHRVDAVSTVGADDWSPFVSERGLELYFASFRPGGAGNSDLYVARRDTLADDFGAPEPLADANSGGYEGAPSFGGDARELFFVALQPGVTPEFDVWSARRRFGGGFQVLGRYAPLSRAGSDETDIELARDGLTAYLASSRPGGQGGRDLWRATRASLADDFGGLEPIEELNGPDQESSVAISADELEVVFASDRAGGTGKLDLWHATRATRADRFDAPVALAELDSPEDDSRPSLSADGRTLYYNYAAAEEGGEDADIWAATRCLP